MSAIQFSHANGFPAKTYSFFFSKLNNYDVHHVDAFGLGKYQIKHNWYPLVDELIEDIEAHGNFPVAGIGHSLGSVITYWAAQKRPDLFSHVIMMDPPYLQWYVRAMLAVLGPAGFTKNLVPIARNAKNRRDLFDSKEEAYDYWRPKKLFQDFHPTCFDDYVKHTLIERADGKQTLMIPKELESKLFSLTAWNLGPFEADIPVYWLVPEKSVVTPSTIEAHKRAFPHISFVPVKGGHMFPLEKPEETANLLRDLIQKTDLQKSV